MKGKLLSNKNRWIIYIWVVGLVLFTHLSWYTSIVKASPTSTFLVVSNADTDDKVPGDGSCRDINDECTLRAAIQESNALAGVDVINFGSQMFISPNSTLDAIIEQLIIDASSVWDTTSDRPGVTISCSGNFDGLTLGNGASQIYGLYITNCADGITIASSNNTIGSTVASRRNVISGNSNVGILISGTSAHHNVIMGNWIGLNTSGDAKAPNNVGVVIFDASSNTIGGDIQTEGNYISGNQQDGLMISGTDAAYNKVDGNIIGRPVVGSNNVGNGASGVTILNKSHGNWVGVARFNDIRFNVSGGITIHTSNNNYIWNNNIYSNEGPGIYVLLGASNNLINANAIMFNLNNGIIIDGASTTQNTIYSNRIHHNYGKGIELSNGGNTMLPPPVINSVSNNNVSGTGCNNCVIEVFSDWYDQGGIYHGWVNADGSGNWTYNGPILGPHVTATNTSNLNTSQFSFPMPLCGVYLPIVRK